MSIPLIGAALAVLSTIPGANAQGGGRNLRMACHLLIDGIPMKEPTVYEVVGNNLFATGLGGRQKISTAGVMVSLGRVRDARGPIQSYATHRRNGTMLTRSVYEQRPGKARRLFFTERFDFARSRVLDSGGRDSCHANGR